MYMFFKDIVINVVYIPNVEIWFRQCISYDRLKYMILYKFKTIIKYIFTFIRNSFFFPEILCTKNIRSLKNRKKVSKETVDK